MESPELLRASKVAAILSSQSDPITKVRRIVSLGYEEEEASMLVESHQSNLRQPIYYEQLPKAPYEDNQSEE